MKDESPQPPQSTSNVSRSNKWCCLCCPVNLKSAIKEHPLAFAMIFMTVMALTVGIGVGFGLDWSGSSSSSEEPCICEEGKFKFSTFVFQRCQLTFLDWIEYLFIVGGSCFTKTEVVSLSENETAVPNCLSNLADHRNEVYNGAGGVLHYEGTYKRHFSSLC